MQLNAPDPIADHLFVGERIMWTGQPKQGFVFGGRDALLIPFSLLWGGFAIFWNISVWLIPRTGDGPDLFFRLWGLPFLAVGLYLIFGRFWHDAVIRKRLTYGVTNQRIVVMRGPSKITSLDIHRLPRLELSEHRDATGTIDFEGNPMFSGRSMNGFGIWVPALAGGVQFFRIVNARSVYEIIQKQVRA